MAYSSLFESQGFIVSKSKKDYVGVPLMWTSYDSGAFDVSIEGLYKKGVLYEICKCREGGHLMLLFYA